MMGFTATYEQQLELNRRGLIYAPNESDASFSRRCSFVSPHPISSFLAKKLFDIDPDWVEIFYSNKGLRLWEGACTWTTDDQITLQLNPTFQRKGSYLGYSKEEVIAHELVHVVRAQFKEPIFEEVLAYQASSSTFRRFWAPFFRTSKESLYFVIALTLPFFATLFETLQLGAFLSFFALIVGGIGRLLWTQRTFAKARRGISQLVGEDNALAVMIRLTDKEIMRFSKLHPKEINSYAQQAAKIEKRWQQILSAYRISGA